MKKERVKNKEANKRVEEDESVHRAEKKKKKWIEEERAMKKWVMKTEMTEKKSE